ncbi:zinc finger protein OZF-like isoform X1 [Cyprinodon tularosa]|uniref:zinc finger protein OZF-like isoform X1 n=1 Tax=Cyprinodon tularosa TaxID=77115 RepID=UPI0018E27433|nr:zinc finger protein OZF-like isoform X1 [Cyprinodon tularosa]
MSSAQSLRHFITERLTAAAEEIFAEFDKTIVRYEEELDRQRKLLEFCWNPQIKLQRIDLPQHRFWRNQEDLRDQQVYNQDNSGLHQEEPEPFQTMESLEDLEPEQMQEKQELCHIKEEQEQQHPLQIKDLPQPHLRNNRENLNEQQIYNHREEPEPCQTMESLEDLEPEQMQEKRDEQELYPIKNEQEQQHPLQIKGEQEELCIGLEEEQLEMKQMMNTFMEIPTYEERFHREPDPDVDHLLVQTSSDSDNQSQEEIDHYDTKSRTETLNNNRHQKIRGQSDDVQSPSLKRQQNTNKIMLSCKICGKSAVYGTLTDHMKTHTGEKPFSCLTCGRKFSEKRSMLRHIRVHTGEKPFQCLTCGKRFSLKDTLSRHIKIHTGEKSYSCSVCGKRFIQSFGLTRHIRTHTRQRPVSFSCLVCGQEFSDRKSLFHHSRNHT